MLHMRVCAFSLHQGSPINFEVMDPSFLRWFCHIVCFCVVFLHYHFIENPPIDLEVTNPSFLRWFCHKGNVLSYPVG
jgi:hypothetical protein